MKFEPFENIFKDSTSNFTKVKKEDYQNVGTYPIVDQSQAFVGGYTDDENIVVRDNLPLIIFGDHTKIFKYVDFPFTIGADGVKVLTLKNKKDNALFYYYFLKSIKIVDKGYSRHFKYLKENKLPIAEYSEQLHIANILSKAENLIAQRKESIRLLDEFLKSTFLEMFGDPASNIREWETLRIRELSLRFSDGPFGSNLKTEHYSDSGIQVIRLQNIGINEFVEKDITYVNTNHYENVLKKYSCYPNDVVIATMGEPNIRACIIPMHVNVAVNKADCVLFRVNPKLSNPYYISHLLNLEGFLFLATSFIHGQTRARISSGQIAKISIPLPPLELQTQFAHIVERTEALKCQYQQSLNELENLYGSLSQRAFRGELLMSEL